MSVLVRPPTTPPTVRRRIVRVVLGMAVLLFVLDLAFPVPRDRLHPRPSTVVLDRDGAMLRPLLAPDEMWRIRVDASERSPQLDRAVLAYEDRYFRWHPGVNPVSLVQAAWDNARSGRIVRGGSTITMQLARMIEPKERTYGHKFIEILRALQLELHYPKRDLLTLYFNHTPYGGNIVGVGAAAYLYFGKAPDRLSLGEAALLAAIPNDPNGLRPDLHPEAARAARRKVLDRLLAAGRITPSRHAEADAEPVPTARRALPFRAPHWTNALVARHPGAERLETTLDAGIQETAERLLHTHLDPLRDRGITNGAVVVIENRTRAVRAYVGSVDFFDDAIDGQVDGARAARSPGSTLKPFIYALAFEHGLTSPAGLLPDVPIDYAGYQPVNYDETFSGAVSAEDALIRSLNVPAVTLQADLGERGLFEFLEAARLSSLAEPKAHYGLALALGGVGVPLLDLTNLYATLADGGRHRPVRLLEDESPAAPVDLLDPGAVHLVTEILSRLRRPDLPAVWEWSTRSPKVAWKTGTSYGHRDAWSVGYTPRYTIGVWAGNFDGSGAPGLVGAEVAAPILLGLFEALEDPDAGAWFEPPRTVERRRVCAVSGLPATDRCLSVRYESYLPGHSPHRDCDVHRLIQVDRETGAQLCSHCRRGRTYDERVYEVWPPDVAAWRARHGHPIEPMPAHLPTCPRIATGAAPVIRSPIADGAYKIRPGVPLTHQQILLDASTTNPESALFWFLDGELVHTGPADDRAFLDPTPGMHTLVCMDDEGRSSQIRYTVSG